MVNALMRRRGSNLRCATIPNFFIVGAPRCGTTALLQYLGEHPQAFVATPKELLFWATDFPDAQRSCYVPINSLDQYLDLFRAARRHHHAVGEGTATYLYSRSAIPNILRFNPAARLIVMLRHPIDLVQSWHGELLYNRYEDEPDFEVAWRLQHLRARGERVPRGCYVPEFTQYKAVGALGTQMERVRHITHPDQVLVLWHDDLASDPKSVYQQALRFLDLDVDDRADFPAVNVSKELRWPWVGELFFHPPRALERPIRFLRRIAAGPQPRLTWLADTVLRRPRQRVPLSEQLQAELRAAFQAEIEKLERATGRTLEAWRGQPAQAP